jgi:UDP-2,3-diacylglucosamine pyrophosphatase LpxH
LKHQDQIQLLNLVVQGHTHRESLRTSL